MNTGKLTVAGIALVILILSGAAGCGTVVRHTPHKSTRSLPSTAGLSGPKANAPIRPLMAGTLPILVPAILKAKTTLASSSSNGHYAVTVRTDNGTDVSFGGDHDASRSSSLKTVEALLTRSQGEGSRTTLGSGTIVQQYAAQALVIWTHNHWTFEVSDTPGSNMVILKKDAQKLATEVAGISLPETTRGVFAWAIKGTVRSAWMRGNDAVYRVDELHSGNTIIALQMIASMSEVP